MVITGVTWGLVAVVNAVEPVTGPVVVITVKPVTGPVVVVIIGDVIWGLVAAVSYTHLTLPTICSV